MNLKNQIKVNLYIELKKILYVKKIKTKLLMILHFLLTI